MADKYHSVFNSLKKDFIELKPIVLFLGAGINYNTEDDLMWETLLNHLLPYALDLSPCLQNNSKEIRDKLKQDTLFPRDVTSTIVKQYVTFYTRKSQELFLRESGIHLLNTKKAKKRTSRNHFSHYLLLLI